MINHLHSPTILFFDLGDKENDENVECQGGRPEYLCKDKELDHKSLNVTECFGGYRTVDGPASKEQPERPKEIRYAQPK
jgi:hypothetical protein